MLLLEFTLSWLTVVVTHTTEVCINHLLERSHTGVRCSVWFLHKEHGAHLPSTPALSNESNLQARDKRREPDGFTVYIHQYCKSLNTHTHTKNLQEVLFMFIMWNRFSHNKNKTNTGFLLHLNYWYFKYTLLLSVLALQIYRPASLPEQTRTFICTFFPMHLKIIQIFYFERFILIFVSSLFVSMSVAFLPSSLLQHDYLGLQKNFVWTIISWEESSYAIF